MKKTLPWLKAKKNNEKISMLTCYDYSFAKIAQKSEIDSLLVGDSLGMVIKGDSNTLSVELEEVVYHVKSVKKGAPDPFLIADMPFGSYQASIEEGVRNAIKLIKAGAEAVKIEGGKEVADLIYKLSSNGIPVVGHVGLTPQYVNKFGGFTKRGKSEVEQIFIKESAKEVEDAGAEMIVLELVPPQLGTLITQNLLIPVIGIGAGNDTDGQVLVIYDLLGMDESFYPGFVKKYLNLDSLIAGAINQYAQEVRTGEFKGKA